MGSEKTKRSGDVHSITFLYSTRFRYKSRYFFKQLIFSRLKNTHTLIADYLQDDLSGAMR